MADLPAGCEHLKGVREVEGKITLEHTMRHFKPKYPYKGWALQPCYELRESTQKINPVEAIEVDGLVLETDEDITRWVDIQKAKPNPFYRYPGDLDYLFNDDPKEPKYFECNGELFEWVGLEGLLVKAVKTLVKWLKNNW